MKIRDFFCVLPVWLVLAAAGTAQQLIAPEPQTGDISGTVADVQNDVLSGATVALDGAAGGTSRRAISGDDGQFHFSGVAPGGAYRVTVSAPGFTLWTSPAIDLKPGQFVYLSEIRLGFSAGITSVTVHASPQQIATEQVRLEEHQRVLGIIPNFYVVYNHESTPLTARLKFLLALRAATDPVTFLGAGLVAATDQAGDTPGYVQGAKGYGQRYGANYANGLTDIMIGGAILPSVLHQDPRYFYQGTGSRKSRLLHALSNPFICRGDNGRQEPNYSSLGGYVGSGAIAETYYPQGNRGPGLVLSTTFVNIGADMTKSLLDEFLLRRFTPAAEKQGAP